MAPVHRLQGGILLLLFASAVWATPYIPPEELARQAADRMANQPPGVSPLPGGPLTLDELDELQGRYLTVEYRGLLDWLTTMQEDDPDSPDYGGQHEGETDTWDIVQTDNTQEALRDWAHYARWTGDFLEYEENIDAAWTYTFTYPAYLEEGGGNPNYYRVHNCGWGLVAAMEYTEAYGEDDAVLAYGDSCASYLDTWRLSWTGQGIELNPLAAGFGAGALHEYAVWRGNTEWEDAAEEIATDVKQWIDADPERLHHNETWAMSGGTAMWGVITALFLDDPDAGAEWLPTVLPEMDIYSGAGSWNNSWTVWYGFAWQRAYQVLGTDETLENALWIANYLLDQAELDDDAGLPGTEGVYWDDQSWTSAYMVWYELEQLLSYEEPAVDAAAVEIVWPPADWPLLVGDMTGFTVAIANAGTLPLPPQQLLVTALFAVDGEQLPGPLTVPVPFGALRIVGSSDYLLEQPGQVEVTVTLDVPVGDDNPDNNVLTRSYTVYQPRVVSGAVTDGNGNGLTGTLHWTQVGVDPERSGTTNFHELGDGAWSFEAAPGEYDLEVIPDDVPHPPRYGTVTVADDDVSGVDFVSPAASIFLVSANSNASTDTLLLDAFEANGQEAYLWSLPVQGEEFPAGLFTVPSVDLLVWSVPQGTEPVVSDTLWQEMMTWRADMEEPGGLIFAGDGLLEALTAGQRADLGVEPGMMDLTEPVIVGPESSPILPGDTLFNGGVLPQEAADEILAIEPVWAQRMAEYAVSHRGASYAFSPPDGAPWLVFGHGLAGINGLNGQFVSREELVGRVLAWFGLATSVEDPVTAGGMMPVQPFLAAWPNPFNPSLQVRVETPGRATLTLYDVLGRRVRQWTLDHAGLHTISWQATDIASGTYFLDLRTPEGTMTRRVTLLR